MKIRIYNAKILTMEEGEGIFEGEVRIEENRIVYVGISGSFDDEAEHTEWDREIDAKGNLVMPGFKKCTYTFRNDISAVVCGRSSA